MEPDELEYEYSKEYRLSKLKVCVWVIALIIGLTIWSGIGYACYTVYKIINTDNKIEFRYTPTLLS